jgi:hypothetical protein
MQKALKKIPFFLLLLVLFFCLHGSVENYGYLNLYEVIETGLIIILCVGVFFGLTWVITKNYLFASLLTFFIVLWYLFFGAIHDFIKASSFLHFLQSYTILLPALLILNIAMVWWLKRSKHLYAKLFLYLNVLFLLFCVADIIMVVNRHFNYKEPAVAAVSFNQAPVTQKPNVYFLLFDEYAGYKSLQDSFGFKNDSLYHFLRQQNFKELPVFANYDFTPFSMSSVLNMQYVPENYRKKLLVQPDIQQRFGEIRNARVFSIFRSMNYKIENYSIFDIKDYPALFRSNGLFPIHAALLTNKIFHNRLIKNIGWWLVTGKFKIPFLKKYNLFRKDDYNKQVEKKVLITAAQKNDRPLFTYAHFLLPHGQFYRDSSGALNPVDSIFNIKHLYDKSLYLSYLKYTNNIIKGLVKNIDAGDPGAIVIIMSDHGFYDYQNDGGYEPYNFDNICFVKTPAAKTDTSNLPKSNVNFFRYLFNTSYGQKLPYLPDSTVFVIEDPAVLR